MILICKLKKYYLKNLKIWKRIKKFLNKLKYLNKKWKKKGGVYYHFELDLESLV